MGLAILSSGEPTGVPEGLGQVFFNRLYGRPLPDVLLTPRRELDSARLFAYMRAAMMGMLHRQKRESWERNTRGVRSLPPPIPGQGEIFRGHSEDYGCDITIEVEDSALFLTMGKGKNGAPHWRFPLRHTFGSTFVYPTTGENAVGLSAIQLVWERDRLVRIEDDWLSSASADDPGTGLGVIERS